MDQSYLFLDLPFASGMPIREGRVHFFAEGRARDRGFDAKNATVALDLVTSRLGALWIVIRIFEGHCACRFCATSEAAVETLQSTAHELAQALDNAGYPNAAVQATLWDGDRLRETANLMRRFSGIDVTA